MTEVADRAKIFLFKPAEPAFHVSNFGDYIVALVFAAIFCIGGIS